MRSRTALAAACLVVGLGAPAAAADADADALPNTAVLAFTPANLTVHVGDTFRVPIRLKTGSQSVDGLSIIDNLNFDCVGIKVNRRWSADAITCDDSAGAILGLSSATPQTGRDVPVATVTYRATSAGTFAVDCWDNPGGPWCYAFEATTGEDILKKTIPTTIRVLP